MSIKIPVTIHNLIDQELINTVPSILCGGSSLPMLLRVLHYSTQDLDELFNLAIEAVRTGITRG